MAKKAKAYRSVRDSFRTGDIVLFSGKGGISAGIKWATLSEWSHVGMVLVLEEYDFVCLWESTTLSDINDIDTGVARKGVQLVPLSSRVQKYGGRIAIRRLQGVQLGGKEIAALMEARRALSGRPYERSQAELIKAAFDGPFATNEEDLSSLFCSELVAEAYQALGLVRGGKKDRASNEYTPADFSSADEDLPWLRGSLGPEVRLK